LGSQAHTVIWAGLEREDEAICAHDMWIAAIAASTSPP
jgi:hypothetical protein